jgi:hypothetical protein
MDYAGSISCWSDIHNGSNLVIATQLNIGSQDAEERKRTGSTSSTAVFSAMALPRWRELDRARVTRWFVLD